MQETTFIYTLSCPESGLVRYVGKSDNPKLRFNSHKYEKIGKKYAWIKSVLNQGLNPVLEIIDEVSIHEWQEKERHYIKLFKCIGASLLNCTDGGDGGFVMSESSKNQMIDSLRKVNVNGKKIYQLDSDLKIINEFSSMAEAGRKLNVDRTPISNACSGKKNSAAGYYWTFDPNAFVPKGPIKKFGSKIDVFFKDNSFFKRFNSVLEASKYFCLSEPMISRYCNEIVINKKYNFKYGV